MSDFSLKERDDIFYNRLSSFLSKSGQLEVKKISCIKKPCVYYVETVYNGPLLLKAHKNEKNVLQQWDFFTKINLKRSCTIPFIPFPNGNKVIKCKTYAWTISPYLSGKRITYQSSKERAEVVTALKKFHVNATGIYLRPMNKPPLMVEKWFNRLKVFKKTEYLFIENGFETLYMDIVHLTEKYLHQIVRLPWSVEEIKAIKRGTWIHGDVASHNFLINDKVHLIDFDLLDCKPQIYDLIQLSQRFLPYLKWDLDNLLSYDMFASEDKKMWLLGTLLPTDVIREWIHFISHKSTHSIQYYLKELDIKWGKRKYFSQCADTMLKSM